MEYGRIKDFYIAAKGVKKSVVKFLVNTEVNGTGDAYTICAEIPNDALKFEMIKPGSSLGFHYTTVFIDIEGVKDIPFEKIGNSRGDEVTFYEHLKTLGTQGNI